MNFEDTGVMRGRGVGHRQVASMGGTGDEALTMCMVELSIRERSKVFQVGVYSLRRAKHSLEVEHVSERALR
jgi:hypothetical protein